MGRRKWKYETLETRQHNAKPGKEVIQFSIEKVTIAFPFIFRVLYVHLIAAV